MAFVPKTPGNYRAERVAHFEALRGLIANKDAIEISIARLRKVASEYSDQELHRFARLIILSEHAPSEWRQTQLERIRNREDALEEIAMSIDHSWLPTKTEDEVFMDELRNEVIREYPNPVREGCPDESALRRVVFGAINEHPDSNAILLHTRTCGPCTRQVTLFVKEKARKTSATT